MPTDRLIYDLNFLMNIIINTMSMNKSHATSRSFNKSFADRRAPLQKTIGLPKPVKYLNY